MVPKEQCPILSSLAWQVDRASPTNTTQFKPVTERQTIALINMIINQSVYRVTAEV
jgi:hypothetical protein